MSEYTANILKVPNGPFNQNTYLFVNDSGKSILIDPGLDDAPIQLALNNSGSELVGIVCTHGHFDHVGSVSKFQKKYKVPFYLHESDVKLCRLSNFFLKMLSTGLCIEIPEPDYLVNDESAFDLGGIDVSFFHTPGHTPGSCVIKIGEAVFTGDTIYKNSMGDLKLPGLDIGALKTSIQRVCNLFQDHYQVYPGHGGSGLWGEIKSNNKFLNELVAS